MIPELPRGRLVRVAQLIDPECYGVITRQHFRAPRGMPTCSDPSEDTSVARRGQITCRAPAHAAVWSGSSRLVRRRPGISPGYTPASSNDRADIDPRHHKSTRGNLDGRPRPARASPARPCFLHPTLDSTVFATIFAPAGRELPIDARKRPLPPRCIVPPREFTSVGSSRRGVVSWNLHGTYAVRVSRTSMLTSPWARRSPLPGGRVAADLERLDLVAEHPLFVSPSVAQPDVRIGRIGRGSRTETDRTRAGEAGMPDLPRRDLSGVGAMAGEAKGLEHFAGPGT